MLTHMRRLLLVVMAACSGCGPAAGQPDAVSADTIAALGRCPSPSGAGTPHKANITADETWTAEGSPHHVSSLRLEATVTVEACAIVQLEPGGDLNSCI